MLYTRKGLLAKYPRSQLLSWSCTQNTLITNKSKMMLDVLILKLESSSSSGKYQLNIFQRLSKYRPFIEIKILTKIQCSVRL